MNRCCQGPQGPHTKSDREIGEDCLQILEKAKETAASEEGSAALDEQIQFLRECVRNRKIAADEFGILEEVIEPPTSEEGKAAIEKLIRILRKSLNL